VITCKSTSSPTSVFVCVWGSRVPLLGRVTETVQSPVRKLLVQTDRPGEQDARVAFLLAMVMQTIACAHGTHATLGR
jgi:hypothetical protein